MNRSITISKGEAVLDSLVRSGIVISAPCGGRGICGKCRVILREGTVRLNESTETPKPGDFFPACLGIAVTDITIELPEESAGEYIIEKTRAKKAGKKAIRAGLGLDIGTTTVQAELICLDTGESLETLSVLNAQRSFGADVMSRINAARQGKTAELFTAINKQTEDILLYFINGWNLSGIELCTVSGNTTMLHLFAGVDPGSMGELPFAPVFLENRRFEGKELSLSAGKITLLPGISAFVGADIVSGLAFLDILNSKEDSLFVDIGTNGEMALWRKAEQRFLCCSTAAGPCFEGAEISCGMTAGPGAINRINQDLSFSTIGNVPPRGICGTALIDVIAVMKQLDAIEETGALADKYLETGFPIAEGIAVSQRDIRQFQLAKSAILSGISVLCQKAGLKAKDVDAVYIAGGLGFYLNLKNAAAAGLLPPEFAIRPAGKKQTAICGNTSLMGAVKSLTDDNFLQRCREIAAKSDHVELGQDSNFVEAFADNMYF